MYPTSVPTQNNHRIVHLMPEQQRAADFHRIEDIGADALAYTRDGLSLLPGLFTEAHNALVEVTDRLAAHLAKRRVLTEEARLDLAKAADICTDLLNEHGDDAVVEALGEHLHLALDASNRVADLLAAEDSIGWHRGIPSGRNR